MNIYVASSWRNERQPHVVDMIRREGHEVYDFRQPDALDHGFHWSEIDPDWQSWLIGEYREALNHPIAVNGFRKDYDAMRLCDVCVLVLPCGRSAHLEAGWFVGQRRPLLILLSRVEPELMYKLADRVCGHLQEVLVRLQELESEEDRNGEGEGKEKSGVQGLRGGRRDPDLDQDTR